MLSSDLSRCVGACVRGRRKGQLQHLFTSKKTTVFSNCHLHCMGACINWSNSESQCGFTKNIYKGNWTSFFFFFFCCCWVILFLFVCVCRERGISDLCAVTWLDCDRHLKRWHSAGPIATAAHDELERCKHGLWSVEPPLSANTRWSTEPPWIL